MNAHVVAIAFVVSLAFSSVEAGNKPVVYNYTGKGSLRTGEAHVKAVFGQKYRIVDFADEKLILPHLSVKPTPNPVYDSGQTIEGYVALIGVLTEDGRFIDPLILRSTNHKLDASVLQAAIHWRGTPARLNGKSIPTLLQQDIDFMARPK